MEFTTDAYDELNSLNKIISDMFDAITGEIDSIEIVKRMRDANEEIQKDVNIYRNNHMLRMRDKACDPESGLIFEKTLTAMERISSYISNAAKFAI